jgi:hypothetical protein
VRKTLTDKGAAALGPRAAPYAVPDPEQRGLWIRVQPTGAKTYYAIAHDPARKQVWVALGRTDSIDIEAARAQARGACACIRAGKRERLAADPCDIEKQIAAKAIEFAENEIEPACYLYRHYDARGDLIYIGISLSPIRRNKEHADGAAWRGTIFKILIEPFATREEALAAETRAIREEFPRFNQVHNGRRHPAYELRRIARDEESAP